MSIQITVTDPANTDPFELRLVVDVLNKFIGVQLGDGNGLTIDPEDNPAHGQEYISPEQAFNVANGNANAAFANNDPSQVFADGSAIVGGQATPAPAGNAPGASSLTPSGTSPAANNGAATAGAVALDSNGLPFDHRIHASNKDGGVKVADGSWRKKRGVDPALVEQVEAELRQAMAARGNGAPWPFSPPQQASGTPTLPAASGVAAVPAPPSANPAAAPSVSAPPLPAPPAPASLTAAPAATAGAPTNFVELIGKVVPLVNAGKLTNEEVSAVCAAMGLVGGLPMLANRADLVPGINAQLDAILLARG